MNKVEVGMDLRLGDKSRKWSYLQKMIEGEIETMGGGLTFMELK